jgi:recombination DNA repair RAD52 pathway protein
MDMYNKVQKVNQLLTAQGAAAVQKFAKLKSTGRDIYGYQPQKVFDAVNQVFGADGWTHKIMNIYKEEKQIIIAISVTLGKRTSEQFGEHRIMGGDIGSAYKSAVTDGIQKALSLFGIGAKAYRGELGAVFNNKVSETKTDIAFEDLKEAAKIQAAIDIEAGRAWWRQNLTHVNELSAEQRKELVKILAGPGDKK